MPTGAGRGSQSRLLPARNWGRSSPPCGTAAPVGPAHPPASQDTSSGAPGLGQRHKPQETSHPPQLHAILSTGIAGKCSSRALDRSPCKNHYPNSRLFLSRPSQVPPAVMLSAAGKSGMVRETREGREIVSSAGRRQEPTRPLPTPRMAAPSEEEEEGEGGCSAPASPGTQGRWEPQGQPGREQQHRSTTAAGGGGRGARLCVPAAAQLHQRVLPVIQDWGRSPTRCGITAAAVTPGPGNPGPFTTSTAPITINIPEAAGKLGSSLNPLRQPAAAPGTRRPGSPLRHAARSPHRASPAPLALPPLTPAAPSAPRQCSRAAALPRCFSQFMVIPVAALPKTQ